MAGEEGKSCASIMLNVPLSHLLSICSVRFTHIINVYM